MEAAKMIRYTLRKILVDRSISWDTGLSSIFSFFTELGWR